MERIRLKTAVLKLRHVSKHLLNLRGKVPHHLIIKDLSKRPPHALQGPLERLHALLDLLVPHIQATIIPLLQGFNLPLHQDILEHLLLILERVPIHLTLQSHH